MSLLDWLSRQPAPRAVEVEHTKIRVEAGNEPNDHEAHAVEYLEKAESMVYSNSFDRAVSVAVIGVGYAVLAVAREIRGLKPH